MKRKIINCIFNIIFYNKKSLINIKHISFNLFVSKIVYDLNKDFNEFCFNGNSIYPNSEEINDILYELLISDLISYPDCCNNKIYSLYFYETKMDFDIEFQNKIYDVINNYNKYIGV